MKEITEISDIVELQAWARNGPLSFNALKEELEAALGEGEDAEEIAQNVMDELRQRQIMLNESYPFFCDGYKVEPRAEGVLKSTYLFCLALTLLPADQIEVEHRAVQFENIALRAAQSFFGGSALRIGAPWRTADIPTYEVLLNKVVELCPNLGRLLTTVAPAGGDAGWDILLVKNFADNLYPRFVALGNCATGRRDWKRKGMETQPTLFWSYFEHNLLSVLITFFVVPFLMDKDARLRKLSPSALTLDRFRLCEHAPESSDEIATWLETQRQNALGLALN